VTEKYSAGVCAVFSSTKDDKINRTIDLTHLDLAFYLAFYAATSAKAPKTPPPFPIQKT